MRQRLHAFLVCCFLIAITSCRPMPPDEGMPDLSIPDLAPPADLFAVDLTLPACGDPVVMARFHTCQATRDEASCRAAGGIWDRGGLSPTPFCHCPTGQDSCVCHTRSECLGHCSASLAVCPATMGRCDSRAPHFGCFCTFGDDGSSAAICVD